MQATIRIRQARPRAHRLQRLRRGARQLGHIAGELLALAGLVTALVTGLLALGGLSG